MPKLKFTSAEIQNYLGMLEETPRVLATYSKGKSGTELAAPPSPKAWSAVEILAHLRACEELWSYSIYAMLSQENPALELLDERRWAKVTRYSTLGWSESLQTFTLRRTELLRVLGDLTAEQWARTANIAGRNHSIFSQTRRMVLHEAEHCEQITR